MPIQNSKCYFNTRYNTISICEFSENWPMGVLLLQRNTFFCSSNFYPTLYFQFIIPLGYALQFQISYTMDKGDVLTITNSLGVTVGWVYCTPKNEFFQKKFRFTNFTGVQKDVYWCTAGDSTLRVTSFSGNLAFLISYQFYSCESGYEKDGFKMFTMPKVLKKLKKNNCDQFDINRNI